MRVTEDDRAAIAVVVDHSQPIPLPKWIYRQKLATRLTHWLWAVSFFFLLMSGLQIFNAHTTLYLGKQSGFEFNNAVLDMKADDTRSGPAGHTTVLGKSFNTNGILGPSRENGEQTERGFPSWATLPGATDLATGRVIHFFFAWLMVGTLAAWLFVSVCNGHLKRDVTPTSTDLRDLPRDIRKHLMLDFNSGGRYNPLQKISYAIVLLAMLPLMVATGLTLSPGMDAFAPWLLDLFGGRQTGRTIHFAITVLLVAFVVVHLVMVLAAGPVNEMRSMITGWYRPGQDRDDRQVRRHVRRE